MLKVLHDPNLSKISNIKHGFFTRLGGVSSGIYASLNCAYHSFDDENNIAKNRTLAMNYFDYPVESLISVRNIHGDKVAVIEKYSNKYYHLQADGMVTKNPKIMLGSDSADCPIVLFVDEASQIIGLAHAGWKGAKKGILEATVNQMISLGAKPNQIIASISPCIHQKSYEVDLSFNQLFLTTDKNNHKYFIDSKIKDHFLFDLLSFVKDKLLKLNLKLVSIEASIDTYTNEDLFYSCRRAKHNNEPFFGGHLSCIALQS